MSLTSLTFASSNSVIASNFSGGCVRIVKTEKFVGVDSVCVIGKLVEGAVAKRMQVKGNDQTIVVSVESRTGDGYCKEVGGQVVLMVKGICKSDYPAGTEIFFEKAVETSKPKGKIIIC